MGIGRCDGAAVATDWGKWNVDAGETVDGVGARLEARNPGRSASQSPSSSPAVGLGADPDRDSRRRRWARAIIRAMMRSPRRSVSRSSAVYAVDPRFAVARRLVDGLRANSFTSLRSAAVQRTAALAKECERIRREKRPPIGLRKDATPYRPAPHKAAHGCDLLQALFLAALFVQYRGCTGV